MMDSAFRLARRLRRNVHPRFGSGVRRVIAPRSLDRQDPDRREDESAQSLVDQWNGPT
jgi:hypothetical protein